MHLIDVQIIEDVNSNFAMNDDHVFFPYMRVTRSETYWRNELGTALG